MREAIEWLIHMEEKSGQTYNKAAKLFKDDSEFCKLLTGLSKDENQHYRLLLKAKQHLESTAAISLEPAYISLDDKTKKKINKPLIDFTRDIEKGKLSRAGVLVKLQKYRRFYARSQKPLASRN